MSPCIDARIRIDRIRVYVCMRMHVYICMCIHVHVFTHTHTFAQFYSKKLSISKSMVVPMEGHNTSGLVCTLSVENEYRLHSLPTFEAISGSQERSQMFQDAGAWACVAHRYTYTHTRVAVGIPVTCRNLKRVNTQEMLARIKSFGIIC